ncbi:unnamed protein product [Lactuca saligna]|uniref:Uncharacterized protein n=1 Tax=Lactuca saligna TaxID=75948 RepID=A0AA35Y6A8_LACSI|nr:unnamed protein product [Lactuca saligna]
MSFIHGEGKRNSKKVEDEEKEQEVYVSGKGLGDDITSSQDATFEDIKETTGEHVTTVAYIEEEQALNSTPKEILKEEAEDQSSDAQELEGFAAGGDGGVDVGGDVVGGGSGRLADRRCGERSKSLV